MEEMKLRFAASLLTLASALLVPSMAHAEEPSAQAMQEAKTRYARGVELYNEGSYAPALLELERANSLAPNFNILYSIGLVQVQLGDYVSALRSFENYLAAGGAEISGDRKKEVAERLASLRGRVASVEVTVPLADAEITLDEVAVGKSPLPQPIVVNPGRHKITAQKQGFQADSKIFTVAGSDTIRISLVPSEEQQAAPAGAPQPEAEPPKRSPLILVGWITTGVLAAGAVTTGVMALSKHNELNDKKTNQPTPGTELDSLSSNAKTLGLVSDICTGAAVVAGGLSLYFTLKSPDTSSPSVARVGFGPGRLEVVGKF